MMPSHGHQRGPMFLVNLTLTDDYVIGGERSFEPADVLPSDIFASCRGYPMQTAGAETVAATPEALANAIAANTIITFANIARARRDTRIGVRLAVPRR